MSRMRIIGRKEEFSQLQTYCDSGKPEFIAVYGRRRIGKTFLIDEFFHYQYSFSVSGVLDGAPMEQMTAFTQAMRKIGYQGNTPQSWMDAFFLLGELLEKDLSEGRRCVIFIDELPCFDTPKAGFSSS